MWLLVFALALSGVGGQENPDLLTTTTEIPTSTEIPITTAIPTTVLPIIPEIPIPIVNISQGRIIGSVADDGLYYQYFGVPYADSTSGTHRFRAPNPPPSFQDEFIANRRGIKCVRPLGVGYEGTEDCLVADVFTPINGTDLPVMVWIKGREFDQVNGPKLSFRHLVEKDVIVVSLNFRESILGFLCLGTDAAPGNAGLKDIIAGLRWVQENIAQFGGDPDNVSLFGHGSGAAAVDLITLSPMSTGLVHKAIAQSGTAIAPWAVTRDNLVHAFKVAEALGHTVTNVAQLSEVFSRTSVAALMAVINELELTDNSLVFAPCLERESLQGVEPFLIKSPFETIVDGDFAQIPFMTGFVEMEGTIRAEEALVDNWLERMEESFLDFLQPDLKFENNEEQLQIAEEIKSFYFGDNSVSIDEYLSYQGDTLMLVSTIREAYLRAAVSNSSIYLYQFSYKGDLGDSFTTGPLEVDKAAHSEELAYLFHETADNVPELDLAVSDILIERWTNFAKTGIPESDSSLVTWEPFTSDNSFYLRILDDDEVIEGTLEVELRNPHSEAIHFWNGIYEDHFLDARSKWQLNDKSEDSGEVIEETGPEEDTGPGEDTDPEEELGPETDEDGDDDEDDDNGSATSVAYTFLIISLFGILNQFHWAQILS